MHERNVWSYIACYAVCVLTACVLGGKPPELVWTGIANLAAIAICTVVGAARDWDKTTNHSKDF